jgi:NAD(P)-dependent dehydrogenase (short-subunit alcohol dehydrogenase family)
MAQELQGKTAIIYGAGGGIGGGVARKFASEGATIHLVGRTQDKLDAVAKDITANGGSAQAAAFDALDERAVDEHVEQVGTVDISFNLITRGDVQRTPLIDLAADDLLRAVDNGLRSNFITARAAARKMVEQPAGGVILHLNSGSAHGAMAGMGSTGPADAATEAFMRYLAAEVGRQGVRVNGIWTAGVEEVLTQRAIDEVGRENAPDRDAAIAMIAGMSALGHAPRLAEVAEVATFLASDRARGITGTMVNATAGLVLR